MDKVHHIATNSTLKKVYELERKSGGELIVMRGRSAHVMIYLKPDTFDFIYIDGSHYYQDVLRDIELAKVLVKDGGCICGDDLEVDPTPEIETIAQRNMGEDFISATMSDGRKVSFHPGVALAVAQHMGVVNREHGFWWIWRQGNAWGMSATCLPGAGATPTSYFCSDGMYTRWPLTIWRCRAAGDFGNHAVAQSWPFSEANNRECGGANVSKLRAYCG